MNNHWIDPDVRVPPIVPGDYGLCSEPVLIWTGKRMLVAQYWGIEGIMEWASEETTRRIYPDVKAWMPLPKPPEDK